MIAADRARYEWALKNVRTELRHIAKVAVYFAQADRQKQIKIGFSTQVENRLYLLGQSRFTTMTLLGWVPGGPKVEREMHAKFDEYSLGHEWFEPAPELLAFIKGSTRHDEPRGVAPKYGRINDQGYNSLVNAEKRFMSLLGVSA